MSFILVYEEQQNIATGPDLISAIPSSPAAQNAEISFGTEILDRPS